MKSVFLILCLGLCALSVDAGPDKASVTKTEVSFQVSDSLTVNAINVDLSASNIVLSEALSPCFSADEDPGVYESTLYAPLASSLEAKYVKDIFKPPVLKNTF